MAQNNNPTASHVSRRKAFAIGATALTGAAALATPAIAQNVRTVRMATSWPEGLGGLADSAARIARRITAGTEGRLNVEIYPAGQLVPPLGVHDAAGNGEIEMYHSAEYYFQGKSRAMNFFATVPMGFTSTEMGGWLTMGGGQALWDELNAQFGVKALPAGGTGVQMGGWFDKKIETLDDFKGLTMRMPGLGGQVLKEMGANPVVMPGGAIVNALFEKSIDATEWVGPYNDMAFGFQKLLSTYMYPGFHEPHTMAALGMNLGFWDSLSPADQALIKTVSDAELTLHSADYYGNNGLALTKLTTEFGVRPTRLPDDVWNEIAKISFDVVASVANDDDISRRTYESFAAYRDLMIGAAPLSQAEYLSRRGLSDVFLSGKSKA